MRVNLFDPSLPQPLPAEVRRGRALPGPSRTAARAENPGRAEPIHGPSFGKARMLDLYRENEIAYRAPALSRFHIYV